MDNIKIYRFFAVNKKATQYVFTHIKKGSGRLNKQVREYLKKYSSTDLFDVAAKRQKDLYYIIFKDNKYVGDISFEIMRFFKQLYLKFVYIRDDYLRQGLSKILFNYARNDIKENFKKIRTISAFPSSQEGKYFLESTNFIPDVYYCSMGNNGKYSIHYLYQEDVFVLDQKEYELVCGNIYNYSINGAKKYVELVNNAKEIDPNFSAKNYQYFIAHKKVKKEKEVVSTNNPLFNISSCFLSDFESPHTKKAVKETVPPLFTKEYLDKYLDRIE